MTSSEGRNAEHVHVVLHSLLGSLFGSLEQGSHIDIESAVGITCSNDFGTTVVAVLTHFGNHDTRLPALFLGELRC